MARRLLAVMLLGLLGLPASAGEWDVEALMAGLREGSGYRATFRETKHLAVLDEPLVQEGTLEYQPPDRLKKVVTRPREKVYDIQGNTLTIADPEAGTRRLAVDSHPLLHAFVATLRGVLAGDLDTLRERYRLSLSGRPGRWELRLEPIDERVAEAVRYVRVRGGGDRIRSVKTVEANGDHSLLEVDRGHGR